MVELKVTREYRAEVDEKKTRIRVHFEIVNKIRVRKKLKSKSPIEARDDDDRAEKKKIDANVAAVVDLMSIEFIQVKL